MSHETSRRIMPRRCRSCPFLKRGKTKFREHLELTGLSEATPICHSTGDSDVCSPEEKLHREDWLCRGARNFQLNVFYKLGFISAPTDEAWEAKRQELGV